MISSQPLLLLVYFLGSILEDIELIIIKCIAPQHWEEEEERHGVVCGISIISPPHLKKKM